MKFTKENAQAIAIAWAIVIVWQNYEETTIIFVSESNAALISGRTDRFTDNRPSLCIIEVLGANRSDSKRQLTLEWIATSNLVILSSRREYFP